MVLNTMDDVLKAFPNDREARKYLTTLRWGKFASCPYCGNSKAYFIEKGERFKCANKVCYKKFSVITNTLLHASNLPLDKWMIIMFIYVKSRGRVLSWEIEKAADISGRSSFIIKEKLDFAWPYVHREKRTTMEILDDLFLSCCNLYEKYEKVKHSEYSSNPYHISVINDISDTKQYNQLVRYAKYCMNVYADWIFVNFEDPQVIIAETFIWMKDNGIKEYDGTTMIKYVWKTINRMWIQYLKDHPHLHAALQARQKEYKRFHRINLSDSYIIGLIKNRESHSKKTINQIKKESELIKQVRMEIIAKRETSKALYDFQSHFD